MVRKKITPKKSKGLKVKKKKVIEKSWIKRFTTNHQYITGFLIAILWLVPWLINEPQLAETGIVALEAVGGASKSLIVTIVDWLVAHYQAILSVMLLVPTIILKWKEMFKKG